MIKYVLFLIITFAPISIKADTCSIEGTLKIGGKIVLPCIASNSDVVISLISYRDVCNTCKRELHMQRTYYPDQEEAMGSLDADEKEIKAFLSDKSNCVFLITELTTNERKIIMTVGNKEIYPEFIASNSLLYTYLGLSNKTNSLLSFKLPFENCPTVGLLSMNNNCCVTVDFKADK